MSALGFIETRLRNTPIGRKLLWITGASTTVGTSLAAGAFCLLQLQTLRLQFRDQVEMLGSLVASYSTAPVAFGNKEEAQAAIERLRADRTIKGAELRLPNGELFARFGKTLVDDEPVQGTGSATFHEDRLHVVQPVILDNEVIAHLHVDASFESVRAEGLARLMPPLLGIALFALCATILTAVGLRGSIVGPVQRLAHLAHRIATEGDYSLRATGEGGDEVGQLTDAINTMLGRIHAADVELRDTNSDLAAEIAERQRLQGALLETSRMAGMAEVATGVLHNVGNVLNSVNVSTNLMREELSRSSLGSLQRTLDLLRQHRGELGTFLTADPRGSLVPSFLDDIEGELSSEHRRIKSELDSLAANIEHIKEIVSMQQTYAKAAALIEQVQADTLFEDALRITQASANRHRVDVQRDFASPEPVLEIDRHKALQILINFVSNAIHATKTNEIGNRHILLRIEPPADGRIRYIVADNGMGIAKEHLSRVFNHGFTTRKDGHGFGLHSGAIAAKALGGSIHADSPGPGHGATFTLEVPLRPQSGPPQP